MKETNFWDFMIVLADNLFDPFNIGLIGFFTLLCVLVIFGGKTC